MSEKEENLPNKHNNKMMENMKLIMHEEQLCDVVLIAVVDEKRIPTNRLILSAASVYFKAMFTGSLKEANEKEVKIREVDGETLQTLVTHCYNGELNLREDNAEKILSAAHLMEFTSIVEECVEFLKKHLSPSNCLGMKFIAERFNCTELEAQAQKIICKNFNQVTKSEDFLQLNFDQLDSLLSEDELNVQQEEDIFNSLMSWVKHDEDNRKQNIPKLLQHVRMPLMNTKFLAKDVKSVCEANGCMKLYIEALEWKCDPEACPQINPTRIKPSHLQDGYLLAFVDGKFEKYCPKLNQWTPVKDMTLNENYVGIIVWNEKLVIVGGLLNNSNVNTVKYWDVKLKMWKDLSPLTTTRADVGLAVLGESLYVVGGIYNGNIFNGRWNNAVYRLDSLTGAWQNVNAMPIAVAYPKTAVFDGCIYVEGTYNQIGHLLRFEPNSNVWTNLGATSKYPKSLLVMNGDLYGIINKEIQRYNKNTNTWATCATNCPNIRRACVFHNRVFVVAYENKKFLLKEYKLSENVWIDLAPPAMSSIAECVYIPPSSI